MARSPSSRRHRVPPAVPKVVLALVALVALGSVSLFLAHHRGASGAGAGLRAPAIRLPGADRRSKDMVHVAFCSDDTDLRSLLVAIKTARASAANPARLVFHIITSAASIPLLRTLLSSYAEGATFQLHQNDILHTRLAAMVMSKSSVRSTFKVAQFFLHEYLDSQSFPGSKVLYLDTDVVVRGDLAEIYDMDLRGRAMAAVRDCSFTFEVVFNLGELRKFGKTHLDPNACIVKNGIHLVDLSAWRERKLGSEVEKWLLRYRDAEDVLWYEGFIQPALTLAISGDYHSLNASWNCHSLGEPVMSGGESIELRKFGFDHQALLYDLSLAMGKRSGTIKPYVAMCPPEAKLLHFSGPLKPASVDTWMPRSVSPLCLVPDGFKQPEAEEPGKAEWATSIVEKTFTFRRCFELWQVHLTERESCALKDIEKEWFDDERAFYDAYKKSVAEDEEGGTEQKEGDPAQIKRHRIKRIKQLRQAAGEEFVEPSFAEDIDNIAGLKG